MTVIYKYPLAIEPIKDGVFFARAEMPKCSTILRVDVQYDKPTIWALVPDRYLDRIPRTFMIVGTGRDAESDRRGGSPRATAAGA